MKCCRNYKIQENSNWTDETSGHVKKMTISDVTDMYAAFIFKILIRCTMVSYLNLLWSVLFRAA
jgi:hypothetical protein